MTCFASFCFFKFGPGMVDAADFSDNFNDITTIEIIAENDGRIWNLKVKICREGKEAHSFIVSLLAISIISNICDSERGK